MSDEYTILADLPTSSIEIAQEAAKAANATLRFVINEMPQLTVTERAIYGERDYVEFHANLDWEIHQAERERERDEREAYLSDIQGW